MGGRACECVCVCVYVRLVKLQIMMRYIISFVSRLINVVAFIQHVNNGNMKRLVSEDLKGRIHCLGLLFKNSFLVQLIR